VGKFVEFFGEGASNLGVPERATIANMAPEYGATMGYFPVDELTCQYLLATAGPRRRWTRCAPTSRRNRCSGSEEGPMRLHPGPRAGSRRREPSVAGPKRPQDRIELPKLKEVFGKILQEPRRPDTASRRMRWEGATTRSSSPSSPSRT